MAKADLQRLRRRVRQMQQLVEDQKRRAASFHTTGHARSARRAIELLFIFNETLVCARQTLNEKRRRYGVEP